MNSRYIFVPPFPKEIFGIVEYILMIFIALFVIAIGYGFVRWMLMRIKHGPLEDMFKLDKYATVVRVGSIFCLLFGILGFCWRNFYSLSTLCWRCGETRVHEFYEATIISLYPVYLGILAFMFGMAAAMILKHIGSKYSAAPEPSQPENKQGQEGK
ncbi:MAG: hypothetical protein HZA50_19580 [Planctomycetes bacterium]|nr:hypothetical protein [Planctomycetota bacterium]